ncbi:hypothetical protein RJ639_045457 [Escallonia herrerae]|uniref:USE1-like protein n=1 Tax=Escallonia herrerae TaxID=1293975 RepID=A0AA88W6N1_9ASTE|nr:hypothetical protein RJ639_045457 [Escallonia herrerae]
MGLSKTEVNLRRLLAAAPQQHNQAKLIHYVATLREQLEKLAEERTPDGLPRVSRAELKDYSEEVEAFAAKLAASGVRPGGDLLFFCDTFVAFWFCHSNTEESQEPFAVTSNNESPKIEGSPVHPSAGLRRRVAARDTVEADGSTPVKLDTGAQTSIEKHRKLQESLTNEMVGLAKQLKERSLTMSRSIKDTEKILDSTEKAVEHSLASTGHASARTMEVNSSSFKTTCFTWLVIFVMTCIFIMVVLLIRVT